mmetsp:Transcript_75899/g.176009  ORF Transcript_75899/g.176009 Transcript_75899/m.176009 type:complete len:269 (-) Transcript_75899:292-1098(-)
MKKKVPFAIARVIQVLTLNDLISKEELFARVAICCLGSAPTEDATACHHSGICARANLFLVFGVQLLRQPERLWYLRHTFLFERRRRRLAHLWQPSLLKIPPAQLLVFHDLGDLIIERIHRLHKHRARDPLWKQRPRLGCCQCGAISVDFDVRSKPSLCGGHWRESFDEALLAHFFGSHTAHVAKVVPAVDNRELLLHEVLHVRCNTNNLTSSALGQGAEGVPERLLLIRHLWMALLANAPLATVAVHDSFTCAHQTPATAASTERCL